MVSISRSARRMQPRLTIPNLDQFIRSTRLATFHRVINGFLSSYICRETYGNAFSIDRVYKCGAHMRVV